MHLFVGGNERWMRVFHTLELTPMLHNLLHQKYILSHSTSYFSFCFTSVLQIKAYQNFESFQCKTSRFFKEKSSTRDQKNTHNKLYQQNGQLFKAKGSTNFSYYKLLTIYGINECLYMYNIVRANRSLSAVRNMQLLFKFHCMKP